MTRYFMTISEAAQLVLQAGALGHESEIFVLDMGPPVKVVDLARDLIRLSREWKAARSTSSTRAWRPGERLHEDLYDVDEERIPTPHPKIFTARQPLCGRDWLRDRLDQLAGVVERPADEVIVVAGGGRTSLPAVTASRPSPRSSGGQHAQIQPAGREGQESRVVPNPTGIRTSRDVHHAGHRPRNGRTPRVIGSSRMCLPTWELSVAGGGWSS